MYTRFLPLFDLREPTSLLKTCQLFARPARLRYARGILLHMQPVICCGDRDMQLSKKAPVVKFHGGGGGTASGTFHWTERGAIQAYQASWQGITEGSSELWWISNLKHNTFYLLPHSGKEELVHGTNSQADFGWLLLPTGSEGQKQRSFTFRASF